MELLTAFAAAVEKMRPGASSCLLEARQRSRAHDRPREAVPIVPWCRARVDEAS
jgi:hypothetical protein